MLRTSSSVTNAAGNNAVCYFDPQCFVSLSGNNRGLAHLHANKS